MLHVRCNIKCHTCIFTQSTTQSHVSYACWHNSQDIINNTSHNLHNAIKCYTYISDKTKKKEERGDMSPSLLNEVRDVLQRSRTRDLAPNHPHRHTGTDTDVFQRSRTLGEHSKQPVTSSLQVPRGMSCVICDMWYVICDMGCVICNMWYVICDVWYVICDMWYAIMCSVWYALKTVRLLLTSSATGYACNM